MYFCLDPIQANTPLWKEYLNVSLIWYKNTHTHTHTYTHIVCICKEINFLDGASIVYKEEQQYWCIKYYLLMKCLREGESRRQLRYTHRVRYESSVNHFFFVLLLRDWYKASTRHRILISTGISTFASLVRAISRQWIILSTHFSNFVCLVRAILRYRIILDSPRFSTFASRFRTISRHYKITTVMVNCINYFII